MSSPEEKYTTETVTEVRGWVKDKLFSFKCTRPAGFWFTAGQFARLGVANTQKLDGEGDIIWRAYSMVSGPYDEDLEFFSIVVPDGAFTSHLRDLQAGSQIFIDKTVFGFLTTARFESGSDLWLLGSGTGLAPFLSILNDPHTWDQFKRVILVHSARTTEELVYQNEIQALTSESIIGQLVDDIATRFVYMPVVTREKVDGCLTHRIPQLLESGELSSASGLPISKEASRFMICGNPDMVKDVRQALKMLGFSPARRNAPGEIAVENYW